MMHNIKTIYHSANEISFDRFSLTIKLRKFFKRIGSAVEWTCRCRAARELDRLGYKTQAKQLLEGQWK
jgi:hypothetical protein